MELWMIVLIAVVALALLAAIKLKEDRRRPGPMISRGPIRPGAS